MLIFVPILVIIVYYLFFITRPSQLVYLMQVYDIESFNYLRILKNLHDEFQQ
jgi:hypothetical protein